jgi:hypothetical protein
MEMITMPYNDEIQFEGCEEEIAFLADDLRLTMLCGVSEDEKAKVPATRIVFGEEKYYVHVYWKLEGKLARHFCGYWRVKVDLESIGTAKEYTSECRDIKMDPCKEDWYSVVFEIGPEDLEPHECGTVYIPAVTLATLDPCGEAGHMWGYCQGSSVMFIEATPHED